MKIETINGVEMANAELHNKAAETRGLPPAMKKRLRRLACALLALGMLMNSCTPGLGNLVFAEGIEEQYIEELDTFDLEDRPNDSGQEDSKVFEYRLTGENPLMLSNILKSVLPGVSLSEVREVMALGAMDEGRPSDGNEATAELLSVAPVEGDYIVELLKPFEAAGLAVYTGSDMYVVKLVGNGAFMSASGDDAGKERHGVPGLGAFKYYTLGRGEHMLSDILAAVGLSVRLDDIETVGAADDAGDAVVTITPVEGDYAIAAARNFSEAALAVCAKDGIYMITLLNGVETRAEEQSTPEEQTEVGTEEIPEEQTEVDLENFDQFPAGPEAQKDGETPEDAGAQEDGVEPEVSGQEESEKIPEEADIEITGYDENVIVLSGETEAYRSSRLKLNLTGGEYAGARLSLVEIEAPENARVEECWQIIESEACQGVLVTLSNPPALSEGESLAVYGIIEDHISDAPIADGLRAGDKCLVSVAEWEGFALVRHGLGRYVGVAEEYQIDGIIALNGTGYCDTPGMRLSLLGGEYAAARLAVAAPDMPEGLTLEEGYSVVDSEGCLGIVAHFSRALADTQREQMALYGVRDGELSETPLAEPVTAGDEITVSLNEWEGFALVRRSLYGYQRLPAEIAGDSVVEVSGVMPLGASLVITPAEDRSDEWDESLFACEIAIVDANGEEFQPLPDEPVEVTVHSEAIRAAQEDGSDVRVTRYGEAADAPEDISVESSADGAVTFAAGTLSEAFSVVTTVLEQTLTASDGKHYSITVTYDSASGIPADALLEVSELTENDPGYAEYVAQSADALKAGEVQFARVFDIALKNPETGEEYQPDGGVQVSVQLLSDDLDACDSLDVVHFSGEADGGAEVVDSAVDGDTVAFLAEGFSVYVVVATTLRQTLTASDGNEYLVTVTYDNTSGIPSDAELSVSEIKEGEVGYEEYVAQSAAALGEKPEKLAFARPFDITLKNPETGEEYQPNEAVQVTIQLLKDDLNGYASVDVIHIPDGAGEEAQVMDTTVHGESVEFETDGFSVFVLCAFTVDFHWSDYTYSIAGEDSITLGELLDKLGVTEITVGDVADVSFSNPEYVEIEQTESDWLLSSLAPFDSEEALVLTLKNGQSVEIKVTDEGDEQEEQTEQTDTHNPKISVTAGEYNSDSKTITYTVTVTAEGDMDYAVTTGEGDAAVTAEKSYPVVINDLTSSSDSDLAFVSGSYTYAHKEGFEYPEAAEASTVNETAVGSGSKDFMSFPVSVSHMYDGDTITLTYQAKVVGGTYDKDTGKVSVENTVSIANGSNGEVNPADDTDDNTASAGTDFDYIPLAKALSDLEGSWAMWTIHVNPDGLKLNGGVSFTLKDTFSSNQSIDYSSISATSGVSYDYRSSTGTFVIPDGTPVAISYRTRIAAEPGENVTFGNEAKLYDAAGTELANVTKEETRIIYPSASDVATTAGNYMVRLYVYANASMQSGISGAQFILMDENHRPMNYKLDGGGHSAGDPVTFTTDSDGYADIEMVPGEVSIEKNTQYYVEMIKAPDGYKKDNSVYGFIIKDNPNYNNYEYYNGDTLKVRLYPEEASLNVSMRFSGNYSLTETQQNNIEAILQKKNGENWEDVESHLYSEFSWGSLTFENGSAEKPLETGAVYRVIQNNQRPWDLPDTVNLTSSYYLVFGSGSDDQHSDPQEFTITTENSGSSFNAIIDNEYEEHELTITKMDKETGTKLAGAVFTVKKANDDSAVTTYTTDDDGVISISGGSDYESETLYYIVETTPPTGYLLPVTPPKTYFYFCNDSYLISTILDDLPEGEKAVNLTETYESLTLDNQKEKVTIPVMKTWQGNDWPTGVYSVVLGLYQSKGNDPGTKVLDDQGQPRTVTLTAQAPYNNNAFKDLPARDGDDAITYFVQEEHVYTTENETEDILSSYVQEYSVSDAGVYVVRNSPAATLTVSKEWYNGDSKVTDETVLAQQSDVTFDIYRSTSRIEDSIKSGGITYEEEDEFTASLTKVRGGVTFGRSDNWQKKIIDLPEKNDLNQPYYYYVLETVPSFGTEVYEVNEDNGTVTIKNQVAPQTVNVTVAKAKLVDDPRPEAVNTDFTFTLALNKGAHPIRSYQVAEGYTTDWNGEVTFTLKPEESIKLTLPEGVTAAVTEAENPEYVVTADGGGIADLETGDGRAFRFEVSTTANNKTVTFTNTLRVICKVIDDKGDVKPFESLRSALTYVRSNPELFTGDTRTVYMLEDYVMPSTDVFDVLAGENITLTTASTTDGQFPFHTDRTENTDTAIITRGGVSGSMLTNLGTLNLEKITLDGAKASYPVEGNGGIVNNSGTLNLRSGTTLQNSKVSGMGGAIYSTGTVNMPGGSITGNEATSGSAIYLNVCTMNMSGGTIQNNSGAVDGAVVFSSTECKLNLSGDPVIFGNTNLSGDPANIYLGVDSDTVIYVPSPGLGTNARIGVRPMETHREIGEQFATTEFEVTENLNAFVNDLYEYRGKVKEGTSTNVVWDGLTLTLKKIVDGDGANINDAFTITLSSSSIRRSSYAIDGNLDNTVTAARTNMPGTIVLRNVRVNDSISIYPLPVGIYSITEAESNYTPTYMGKNTETDTTLTFDNGSFALQGNSTVTVTNTRKLASVKLTKTLDDRLAGNDAVDFTFTVKLTEADGTAVAGFALAEGITTNEGGVATFTMSPTDADNAIRSLLAPVGASMTVTETVNSNYRITASAKTMPTEGEGAAITDADTDSDNVFTFTVTEDGADVTFANVRKMAEIELSKTLVGKVSKTEAFTFTLTLTNGAAPVANYIVYRDEAAPENNITTDANGVATIPFTFVENETEAKSILLTIPEGTKLVVAETEVKKNVNGTEQAIYNTSYSVNGGSAVSSTTVTINAVSDADKSIAFTNTRKTQKITVTNTVAGYSGNVVPFTYTAKVTDGGENQDDYDLNGFKDGEMTFELTTGQQNVLIVPYGATLTVTEGFIVGYGTTVKRGSAAAVEALSDTFVVTADINPLQFTNSQLIGLRIVNNTSSTLENVKITVGKNNIYLVNEDQTGQERISTNKTATISVEAGKTAILEIQHDTSVTAEQDYTVKGITPAVGYYYTINNEPSFHETANPAILRVYNAAAYEVKGKLRYSVNDSTVTFTEQPLVSFDSNGGAWTTEMDGYRDRDGDRKVYQKAVNSGETVAAPTPNPVYPTAEGIAFLGWTTDKTFAEQAHTESEDISANLYDFENTLVTTPFTLYAIWARDPSVRTVTVKNGLNTPLTVTVTLTNDDPSGVNYTLYEDTSDPANNITTDASGAATFTLAANETRNLHVPNGAKLVISGSDGIAYSTDFTDGDSTAGSFTINSVDTDGTVSFIGGIFKVTDVDGNLLYDANGNPAVYGNLRKTNKANPDEAFDAYEKTLYTDASHTTKATPAAVKQLVDEYTIPNTAAIAFPNKTMTLTTAGKDDADFPYVGVRERATIYRSTAGANANCFTLASGNITLTEIILDGGSENGVKIKIAKTANGGLIYMNNASGVLNVTTGTTMRNCEFAAYDDGNNSRGGAIYQTNGTLNVNAGLFSNLHAYQGGAICVTGGTLNVKGEAGSTQFEDCSSEKQDGGAIYYKKGTDLEIDGGNVKENPGIIFTRCVAAYTNGTGDGSDGGAIFATSDYKNTVTVKGCSFIECSARTGNNVSTSGYGGGGICAYKVMGLTVEACTFEACDSLCGGGAVAAIVQYTETVANETVTIKNCSFNQCNCKGQAGALGVYQDNNGATNSATKLSIIDSSFTGCSSGTNNGSGGAVQCYLPCMVFSGSSFTDCWAGKEGGAVNNFFGGSYTQEWAKSSMTVTNCRFVRCRAEDRYDTGAVQHYGGGINTKAKTVTVTGSYFEDCVSTLREGGALHIGGQAGGSTATITGSTFKNCTAKNGGGAVLSSHETLTIENSNFYGCESSASNGGAVYHTKNSRGDSTQNTTTINNSVFGVDPDDSDSLGCRAANNGGAIWTRAGTASITGCTISNCVANNGGAVYLSKEKTASQSGTITNGTITGCEATKGSAVYVENKATFSGSLSVSGNTVSDINDGAIHGGALYFEGNVKVENNTCSSDSTYNHDVLMQNNNATTIYTTSVGLGREARIGVYVISAQVNNRGVEGKAFGTWTAENGNNYLDAFFNNRNDELYGCEMDGDHYIYWGNYICKITDAEGNTLTRPNGRDAVYQRLSQALDEFTLVSGGDPVYIKMLIEDYAIRQTAAISNFPNANITLTTASVSDAEHPYRGTEGTVCTISRTSGKEQLFKLNTAEATFQLEDITLDGRNDKSTDTGNYRLIEAAAGALVINGGTTLQYGAASNGGAIEAAAVAQVVINGVYDAIKQEPTVKFINCTGTGNNKPNGGAIRAYNLSITNSTEETGHYGTAFINCSAYNGGAITSRGSSMSINGVFFDACQTQSSGGAVYHNYSDANSTSTFKNCAFENCVTNGNTTWAHGGAIEARTAELSVEDCSFKNCSATSDGGAVYHGYVDGNNKPSGNREKTTIKNTTFDGCSTTGSDTSYNYGGSVYTQAKTIEVIDSSFKDSTSANHGGALYCQSNVDGSAAAISGTRFDNCSTSRSGGSGGAIYSNTKALTLQKNGKAETTINACKAPGYSGAVHMETSGSVLNIKDSTVISSCYANQGGAIYLPAGVTMNLTGSPEFTKNGYTTTGQNATAGACIYLAEDSRINLSGSPKFSRNNITNDPRIINGGIMDYVRQDLYLAGYPSANARSIHIEENLTGDTIWIWPENDRHKHQGEQFGMTVSSSETVNAESLSMLRNALPDDVTGCSNGEYLAGVRLVGQSAENVYWSKMYNISFRKKDNKAVAVPGAEFTLYSDKTCSTVYSVATSADGETDADASGELLPKGTVDFTAVPMGVYYMKETTVPTSFKPNDTVYLVLVGTPNLRPNINNQDLWKNGGPLDVSNAATLVARYTTDAGRYFGIYPLGEDGKADVSNNLASTNVGIINIRNDYQAWFMKVDGSGAALPNAAFTVYEQVTENEVGKTYANGYPFLKRWSRTGEEEDAPDPVKSADGTSSYKKLDGTTVPKGVVYFRELPIGTYYLVETTYPTRNGNNRITFYVEEDRVFKLEVTGKDADNDGEYDFTLSEWQGDGNYSEVGKQSFGGKTYYTVSNMEAVCKLTDGNDKLLYKLGHDGSTLLPAVYASLEQGFDAAQKQKLYSVNGAVIADSAALKLEVLKDFTLNSAVIYSSKHALTFTTAERTASASDKYVFTTNRTSDTSRAEIKRHYSEANADNANAGALITVDNGASLTLKNIKLDGQKSSFKGRAIHVTNGSALAILNNTQIQSFRQEAVAGSADGNDVKGGAILMDDNTTLTVDGGASSRSAVFTNNEVVNSRSGEADNEGMGADGGAIAVGKECTVSLTNAQFTNNSAIAATEKKGNGGAVSISKTREAETQANLPLKNVVFRNNTASYQGGALRTAENVYLTVENSIFQNNSASTGDGGAIAALSKADAPSALTIVGGALTGNTATSGNGGAVKIGGYGTLVLKGNVTMSRNSAANGGAVTVAPGANVFFISGTVHSNTATANGGAFYVEAAEGKVSKIFIRGGSITGNSAVEGSAVYAQDYAEVTISGGSITGNTVSGDNGGAVNVGGSNARANFSGSPTIFNNLSGAAQRNVVLSNDSNEVIQVEAEGIGKTAKIGIYVIDEIDGTDGDKVELYQIHGLSGKPFGTFANNANLDSFVNDRNLTLYGVKNEKDDTDHAIYWLSTGVPIAFRKIDSFGEALAGATFSLYTDQTCTQAYEKTPGEALTAVSADGTNIMNNDRNILGKGTVLFEQIPAGVYYMKETVSPTADPQGNPMTYNLENTYVVLVGASAVRPDNTLGTLWATDALLADITQEMVNAQIEKFTADKDFYKLSEDAQYAIFLIDPTTGKAVATPDIARYGIMNISTAQRKAILKKVEENTYKPLPGAVFEILRYDHTLVSSTDINGTTTTSFTSGDSGVYFIDMLPFGTYYLHETKNASGAEVDLWFILTVNENGVGYETEDLKVINTLRPETTTPD